MNPTGVFFIRQAGKERPGSQADPATLSSLGIWHGNVNKNATQAGRQVSPGATLWMPISAVQPVWTLQVCCTASLTVCIEEEKVDRERMLENRNTKVL